MTVAPVFHQRDLGSIRFVIADLSIELKVTKAVAALVRRRYRGFTQHASLETAAPHLRLLVSGREDAPAGDSSPRVDVTAVSPSRVLLEGEYSGHLDLEQGLGMVEGPDALLALDVLLRLALGVLAPSLGWVLLHGAAIAMRDGTWAVLIGESGAGKSTAARTFQSFCDELVLVRPGVPPNPMGSIAASTPYWHGRPASAACGALVCLKRDGDQGSRRVRGAEAVRLLTPHVVRPVHLASIDRKSMEAVCGLARDIPVFEVSCPRGGQYLPYLEQALATLGCSPLERRRRRAGAA